MIGIFVGFSRIFLLGILIFKGLTARRLYKSFGVKGLTNCRSSRDEEIQTVVVPFSALKHKWVLN
jgi:hypothetical protein